MAESAMHALDVGNVIGEFRVDFVACQFQFGSAQHSRLHRFGEEAERHTKSNVQKRPHFIAHDTHCTRADTRRFAFGRQWASN